MAEAAWLEISLTVDGEQAEAVAEVLARHIPNGIVIESTAVEVSTAEEEGETPSGQPVGPLRVCGYLPMDEQMEEKRQRIEEGLWHLGKIRPLPEPRYQRIQEANWMEAWKQHYRPIPIGESLLILPAWLEKPGEGRTEIRIEPGMAFGTGTHPTTQLSLELLEKKIKPGQALIDVGCGSGILSIAAAKLGATPILGVDIDREAVSNARENAAMNGVGHLSEFQVGSLSEIKQWKFNLRNAPVVVANILAPVLIRLLEEGLEGCVSPGGVLILSGILEEKVAEVQTALVRRGLAAVEQAQIEDWVALVVAAQ